MEKMDDLVSQFHSLRGNNLQEVKRSFSEFLNIIRRDVPREADLDTLIDSIKPKTKLESVLKVDILIDFKRYGALLDVLKSENPMLIAKVLKCWNFFEVVFSKIDAQTLVGQIFPRTSYSTRIKIITRLSKILNEEKLADAYFHAIEDKYGLFAARGLLPACSLDLIKSTVDRYEVIFSGRQLQRIVKRNPQFLGYYLDVLRRANGEDFDLSEKYSEVLRYVAKIDCQLFWELFKKYGVKVKFGHRMTPDLYEDGKKLVTVSDYKRNFFSLKKVYRIVRKNDADLRKLLFDLYPKKLEGLTTDYVKNYLRTLVGCLSKHNKYEIVNDCFKEAYGKSIHELYTADIPEEILQLIPPQEREAFVDHKILQNDSLVYMYPTRKSIPLIRERIKYTSDVQKRSELAVLLCKTCQFNEDLEGTLEVCKYVRSRHKNDQNIVIDFLKHFYEWKLLKNFNEEHWSLIYELLKLVMPHDRMYHYGTYLMGKYLHYFVKNKLPCDEFMRVSLKYSKEDWCFGYELECDDCRRFYYESFARLIPQMCQGDDFERLSCTLLSSLAYFNERHPKNKLVISNSSQLMPAIKTQLTKENYYNAKSALSYCIKFDYGDGYEKMYWENLQRTRCVNMIIWYLRNKPWKILEHIEDILKPETIRLMHCKILTLLKLISLLSFSGVTEKIIIFAKDNLHHEDLRVTKFSATALSYLTRENEYLETVQSFLPPSDGKIDVNTMKESYVSAQKALLNGLSNCNDTISCFPSLLKFCVGDYMKHALGPLYRIANRIPESKLKDFLYCLYQSAVSVRKHAVNLTAHLETKERIYNFLKAAGEGDGHPSLQKIIFKSTLRFFRGNPGEKLWDLLKQNIKKIDENDREAFTCLANLRNVPIEYQLRYAPMAYEILANNPTKEISAKKYDLLKSAPNNLLDRLDVAFLKRAIRDTMLQPDAPQENDFYFRSVLYTAGKKQMDILSVIQDVLRTYSEENWGDLVTGKIGTDVYDIIRTLCLRAIKINADNFPIQELLRFWGSSIKRGELLEEYLLLQLTDAYLSCPSEGKAREYGVKVSGIYGKWVGLHGQSIIPLFAEELIDFSSEFLVDFYVGKRHVDFVDGLLWANGGDFNSILGLNVLFRLVHSDSVKTQFDSVFKKIRTGGSPTVRIHLYRLLRDFEK